MNSQAKSAERDAEENTTDDEEAERELLADIVPWSPWKAAVVALKRKQNDRGELGECTGDLNEDESPFSYLFQVSELLRSTTKQLGEDPESLDFRQGFRSLAKQPAGCRLLGTVAPLMEPEVLQDTLSLHLIPLPGSRERWLKHVRATAELSTIDPLTGAETVPAELVQSGELLRLVQTSFASPASVEAVLSRLQAGAAAQKLLLVRYRDGVRLVPASKVVLQESVVAAVDSAESGDVEPVPEAEAEAEAEAETETGSVPAAAASATPGNEDEEPAAKADGEDTDDEEAPPPEAAAAAESKNPDGAESSGADAAAESVCIRETLGNLRHKREGESVLGNGRWEKRRITLSGEEISFFRREEVEEDDEVEQSPRTAASATFIRFLDHVHSANELVHQAFTNMDTNQDGELDEEELFNGLQKAGISISRQLVSEVHWALDTDGDSNGKVSIREFTDKLAEVAVEWKRSYSDVAGSIVFQDARCEYEQETSKSTFKIFSKGYEYEVRVSSDAEAAEWAESIQKQVAAATTATLEGQPSENDSVTDDRPTPHMFQTAPQETGIGPPVSDADSTAPAPAPGAFRVLREISIYLAAQGSGEKPGRKFMNDFVADKVRACLTPACTTPFYLTMRLELARELGWLAAAAHDCRAAECLELVLRALQGLCADPNPVVREICARMLPEFSRCLSVDVYSSVAEAYSKLAVDPSPTAQKSLLRHTQLLAEGFMKIGRRTPPATLLAGFVSSVQTVVQELWSFSEKTTGAADCLEAAMAAGEREMRAVVEATLDACLALLKAAGCARWQEIKAGLEDLLLLANDKTCSRPAASLVVGQVAKRLHLFAAALHVDGAAAAADAGDVGSTVNTLHLAAGVCMSENCPPDEQRQLHCRLAKILWALDEQDRKEEWLDKMVGAYDYHLDPNSEAELRANDGGANGGNSGGGRGQIPLIGQVRELQREQREQEREQQHADFACVLAYNLPAAIALSCRREAGHDTSKWKTASGRNGYKNSQSLIDVHARLCIEGCVEGCSGARCTSRHHATYVKVKKSLASSLPAISNLVGEYRRSLYVPRIYTSLLYGADSESGMDSPRCDVEVEIEVKDILLGNTAKLAAAMASPNHDPLVPAAISQSRRVQAKFLWLLAKIPPHLCIPGWADAETVDEMVDEDSPWCN